MRNQPDAERGARRDLGGRHLHFDMALRLLHIDAGATLRPVAQCPAARTAGDNLVAGEQAGLALAHHVEAERRAGAAPLHRHPLDMAGLRFHLMAHQHADGTGDRQLYDDIGAARRDRLAALGLVRPARLLRQIGDREVQPIFPGRQAGGRAEGDAQRLAFPRGQHELARADAEQRQRAIDLLLDRQPAQHAVRTLQEVGSGDAEGSVLVGRVADIDLAGAGGALQHEGAWREDDALRAGESSAAALRTSRSLPPWRGGEMGHVA